MSIAEFKLIHEALHFRSEKAFKISKQDHLELMAECDGYGKMSQLDLIEKQLTWDWSHVRDSSDEALDRVFEKLILMDYIKLVV